MNEGHFLKYKRRFRRSLHPMFAILVAKRQTMDATSWRLRIDQMMHHAINNPLEYLGNDLPPSELIEDILNEIRNEFLKEMMAFDAVPRH